MTTPRPEFGTTSPDAASDDLLREYRDYLLAAAEHAGWHDTHRWEGPPPSVDEVRRALLQERWAYLPLVDDGSEPDSGAAGLVARPAGAGSRVHNLWHLARGDTPPFDRHR